MPWRLKCCTRHRGPVSCCALPIILPPRAAPEQARAAVPTRVCPEDIFAVGKHNPGKTGLWVKLCWRFSRVCVKCSMPVTAHATGAAGQDSSNATDQSILCHGLQPEAPAKPKSFHISEAPSVSMFVPPHRWTQQLWVRQQKPQLPGREGAVGGMGLMECPSAAWGMCQPTPGL